VGAKGLRSVVVQIIRLIPSSDGASRPFSVTQPSVLGMALVAPKPTPMITLTNDEVGWTAVIPELLGPRYR
jgi:hypothetical protein